ncbi:MAG: hypothetical protein QNJ63_03110 [Calothrix sp. MO_192.B10]|nr:hypothetical protein [Calothrix sp. MO_192.B10]
MVSLIGSPDSTLNVINATKRLARAIAISQGQFSLLLACCNSVNKQQQLLGSLMEFSPVKINEIILPPSTETLYTTISNILGDNQPPSLIVRGLESITAMNQLIVSTNIMRDEFPKKFQFPLVLWINDDILRNLIWLAPDLKDWAATTIRFDAPRHTLVEQPALIA